MNKLNDKELSLKLQTADYAASALKSALGAIPYAGSLLSEIAGTVIPNQRIERIVKFAEALGKRLVKLEPDFVTSQLKDETFTDLVEEGLRQASRSLSDERRKYIASIIANSLSSEDIEYQESKHLLRILDEISDIEIIWLRFYLVSKPRGDDEFRDKHTHILQVVTVDTNTPQSEYDKKTLQESYKEHLAQLGLLTMAYDAMEEKVYNGPLSNQRYGITSLGKMLLKEIGLSF